MNDFVVDFGEPNAGESNVTAIGTTQATAYVLRKAFTVFSSVPPGTGAVLPSSYAPGVQLTLCNRDPTNALLLYPALGDRIEAGAINAPVSIAAGSNFTFVSFAPPLSPAPRVWFETESFSLGNYLPLSGGTMTGPLTFDTWTTAGRPAVPAVGATGWNTTLGYLESWNGAAWVAAPGANIFLPLAGGTFSAYSTAALNSFWSVPPSTTVTLTVGTDVATIDAAFTAIQQWVIPLSSSVVIQLPTGATARSTPIIVDHPYGARITLQGVAPATTTATAAGAVTGATNAWAVPLTVVSATNIVAGDYALIRNVTGTGQFRLFSGICRVASVVGTTVTVTNTARNAAWPTAALTGADVTVLKTRLVFTGCDGIQVDGPLGALNQMALIGDQTVGTIGLISQRTSSGSKAKGLVFCGSSFGISGFGDGGIYAMYAGTVIAPSVCVANCSVYCVYGQQGGSALVDNGVLSGCVETGIGSAGSGAVSAQGALAVGNGLYGAFSFQGGAILIQDGFFWSNVSDGIRWAWGGSVRGNNVSARFNGGNGAMCVGGHGVIASSTLSNNVGAGAYVEGGGSAYASGSTLSNNGTYGGYVDGGTLDMPNSVVSSNTINGVTVTNNGTALADALSGTANGTYLVSASRGGVVRATGAVTGGATLFADSGGLIDATGATGSPVLSYGSEGVIIGAATTRGSMLFDSAANLAIGATSAEAINVDRATTAGVRFARSATLKALFGVDDGGSIIVGAASGDAVIRAGQAMWFAAGGANERGFIDANGSGALGRASLGTAATDGFFYIPSCAGTPTGTPTAKTGRVPLVADSTGNKLYAYLGGGWATQVITVLRSYLSGLITSRSSATVLAVSAGECTDSTNATDIQIGAFTKSTAGAWTAGTGNNGMGSGLTIANSTWYHVFVIINSGTPDVYFDTSVTAANKPTNTTAFRRIGSFRTDGSAQIVAFSQNGDEFLLSTTILDVTGIPLTSAVLQTLTVPNGVKTNALFRATYSDSSGATGILFTSPDESDQAAAPAGAGFSLASPQTSASFPEAGTFSIRTNTSSQIRYRASATSTNGFSINTYGWIDTRGRFA